MERRSSMKNKRKAAEELEMNRSQRLLLESSNQSNEVEFGPRDIVIDQAKISVKIEDIVVKNETKVEPGDDIEPDNVIGDVKLEIEDQKYVVVNEEETICKDDEAKEQTESENKSETFSEISINEDQIFKEEALNITGIEQCLSHVMEHLEVNNILICREVSKTWRFVVDEFLKSKIIEEPYDNNAYLLKMRRLSPEQVFMQKYRRLKYSYYFKWSNDPILRLQSFNVKMAGHRNSELSPFIGSGKVSLVYMEIIKEQNDTVNKFFEIFGKHIHSLKIKERNLPDTTTTEEFVQLLTTYLGHTPNLKQLTIRIDEGSYGKLVKFGDINGLYLPKNLNSFSLKVKEGKLVTVTRLQDIVFAKLIKPFYERQLQTLAIYWPNKLSLHVPSLREISLIHHTSRHPKVHCLKLFAKESFFGAPIEKLHLKVSYTKITFAKLLEIIEMLPSLEYLKLSGRLLYCIVFNTKYLTSTEVLNNFSFQTKIHTLELASSFSKINLPYDFFRAFPKLKYFTMRLNNVGNIGTRYTENISTHLSLKNLLVGSKASIYETKLWEILPDLEIVAAEFYTHKCNVYKNRPCSWNQVQLYSASNKRCRLVNVIATRDGYRRHVENKSDSSK